MCGSPHRSGSDNVDGVLVHRINYYRPGAENFGPPAAAILIERHRSVGGFDVVESPECNAEGAEFLAACPDVPLVVKLHTPLYLMAAIGTSRFGFLEKTRFALGALRRGQLPRWPLNGIRDH